MSGYVLKHSLRVSAVKSSNWGPAGWVPRMRLDLMGPLPADAQLVWEQRLPDGEKWLGSPACPDKDAKRQYIGVRRLPDLLHRVAELEKRIADERETLAHMKFQQATKQIENTSKLKLIRRDIARMMTALNQRKRNAVTAKP